MTRSFPLNKLLNLMYVPFIELSGGMASANRPTLLPMKQRLARRQVLTQRELYLLAIGYGF